MPIYEYHCTKCGKDHEVMQKMTDKAIKTCPVCGGKVEKKLAATAFQLKGSGWYKDGYSSPAPSKKSETAGGGTTPSGPSKSDSKDTKKKTSDK